MAEDGPQMPKMQLSQIVPLFLVLGMNKLDLTNVDGDYGDLTHHMEASYVTAQIVCFIVMYFVWTKVQALPEGGSPLKIPEQKSMGQVVKPASEMTVKEYDIEKFKEAIKQAVMQTVILGGIYYKWRYTTPLILQSVMTPLKLYESELVKIHALGRTDVKRPFPVPNPFGLPSTPEPEPEAASAAIGNLSKAKKKASKNSAGTVAGSKDNEEQANPATKPADATEAKKSK
jgi:hypothetical protein